MQALNDRAARFAQRGGGGPGPSYSRRLAGMALRDEYSEQAGEAAALTRLAPAMGPSAPAHQAQRIRDTAMAGARQQTVMHYDIRRGMAQDADRAAEMQADQIREMAKLALQGRIHEADRVLKERGLLLEERGLEDRAADRDAYMQHRQEDLQYRKEESAADRDLRKQELKAAREERVGENMGRALDRKADQESRALRDVADLNQAYTPESVTKYKKSKDPADLIAREKRTTGGKILGGTAMTGLKAMGYDVDSLQSKDENGKTVRGQEFQDLLDVANQLQADNPDLAREDVLREAAESMGLGSRKADASELAPAPKSKPHPDAEWDDDLGQWILAERG